MPISNDDELQECKQRVFRMYMDTIQTFHILSEYSRPLFGESSQYVKLAIEEYLDDFFRNTEKSGETHPEVLIFEAPLKSFQQAGFYGAQLNLKEKQVLSANTSVREWLAQRSRTLTKKPFLKWIDIINNFLGSLASATGLSEALKELKDCLRDEMPDDEE